MNIAEETMAEKKSYWTFRTIGTTSGFTAKRPWSESLQGQKFRCFKYVLQEKLLTREVTIKYL